MGSTIRVLIADDDQLIREGLTSILSQADDLKVVAVTADGREAIEQCVGGTVDVALLDARMPVVDGPAACARITAETDTRVCILSTFDDHDLVERAVAAGASGYLLKGVAGDEVRQAVRLVAGGHSVFKSSVFQSMRDSPHEVAGDLTMLTEREREIAQAITRGMSNREISETLHLSEGTVKNYISSILSKLGLAQRTQIAIYCLRPDQLSGT
jgi:DNA-binding NarL/FixJ family response regulator